MQRATLTASFAARLCRRSCAKCAKYSDKTIGQCKFFTFDGVSTCWMKSNSKGYRAACKTCVCGAVGAWKPPVPPPPPPPAPPPLPKPVEPAAKKWDGKPVQVYILMGQSNCVGMGRILGAQNNSLESAVFREGKFPWLKNGNTWSIDGDTRNIFIMASGNQTFAESKLGHNEWMTPDYGDLSNSEVRAGGKGPTIGPEFGIAHFGGNFKQDNVMILKSCIGNRALGYDLLPVGTPRANYTDKSGTKWTYAGYGDSAEKWRTNESSTIPAKFGGWYAGKQWDGDTGNAKYILNNITNDPANPFFPRLGGSATKFEVAGFFWWQGDRDSRDAGLSALYETHLVSLIKTLRTTFDAPTAPFVTAALGQSAIGSTNGAGEILTANLNVGCNGQTNGATTKCKYPEFKGNVAAVYTHPLENTPGSSGAHYGGDAITYMNVGIAMGEEMAKMKAAQSA